MSTFIALAAVMLCAALAAVLWPLLARAWRSPVEERSWSYATALIAAVTLPIVSFQLYDRLSSWPWDETRPASQGHALADTVRQLEQRLRSEPGDVGGWMLLGRSYAAMEQPQRAAQAYREAYRLTNGRDAGVMIELAEALALVNPEALAGEGGELLERALALAPNNPKALWYGGLAAYAASRPQTAVERWRRLLAQGPPERLVELLTRQIADVERQLGNGSPQPPGPAPVAAAGDGTIEIRVSLSAELGRHAGDIRDLPLFVIARDAAAQSGPPVAVARRQAAELPLQLTLSDADAMLPNVKLSALAEVRLIARVSFGGQPIARSGDLYGEVVRRRDAAGPVELVIDRVVP